MNSVNVELCEKMARFRRTISAHPEQPPVPLLNRLRLKEMFVGGAAPPYSYEPKTIGWYGSACEAGDELNIYKVKDL